jgi:DNA-directed RNA polymerase specialized sigma subunit
VAATRHNPEFKVKFSTYAWNTVSGYIRHALRDHSRMVRPNRRYLGLRQRVRDLLTEGRSFEEVAETLDITVEDVLNCELSWKEIYLSIDYKNEDEDRYPVEIGYEEEEEEIVIRSRMIELIHRVSDKDLDLLERFYEGKVKKQEEIDRAEILVEYIKESMDAPPEY